MIARLSGMANRLTRDKADTLLLLLAALMVLAPHFGHLPLWTSATVCLTLAWRAAITLRGSRLPPMWLLLPVSLLAMGGVYLTYRTLLGREAGVTMLALLLTFKLLEMHARRDLFVVIFLSFFLLLTNFFYSQSIMTALAMIATIIVLLSAQITFQFTGAVPPLAARLKLAGRIFLIAAPLGVLLFVVFPRIQGPLWGLPGDASSAKSGMSDTMSPVGGSCVPRPVQGRRTAAATALLARAGDEQLQRANLVEDWPAAISGCPVAPGQATDMEGARLFL
jgi:protein-glutamine gamma-glutamyltransferase